MAAGYTITVNTSAANNKSVAAFDSGTYLCSAALAFTPTSALSSFIITNVDILGASSALYTVSANTTLPCLVVNGVTNSILFNVTFANSSPSEAGTTLAYLASARIKSGSPALSAGSTDTLVDGVTAYSATAFTISGAGGWRGIGSRIWDSKDEHTRKRVLGII